MSYLLIKRVVLFLIPVKIRVFVKNVVKKAAAILYRLAPYFEYFLSSKSVRSELGVPRLRAFKGSKDGIQYNYKIHHPDAIDAEDKALLREDLFLVGSNWIDGNDKPIALLWGFNDWKWGFVSEYLSEYRTVFVKRKISEYRCRRIVRSFHELPKVSISWGFNEPRFIGKLHKKGFINLFRMEDGFLRSLSLGASHSTPYSLVLDKSGLYYDPSIESELEKDLNTLKVNESELRKARICRDVLLDLHLSKYNEVRVRKSCLSIPSRRRIAVIGQVDSDMSIKLGNPDGWTFENLIMLAYKENPAAEIIYRPHPDVYRGYQRTNFRLSRIKKYVQISSPDQPLHDFIESVDHVYTITSLSGFEALLRGKKVTTVGAPFYAGWGLTDDRLNLVHRSKVHTVDSLFYGAFLLYPRYLGTDDSFLGFMASAFSIEVEREQYINKDIQSFMSEDLDFIFETRSWPSLIFRSFDSKYELTIKRLLIRKSSEIFSIGSDAYHLFLISVLLNRFSSDLDFASHLIANIKSIVSVNCVIELIEVLSVSPNYSAEIESLRCYIGLSENVLSYSESALRSLAEPEEMNRTLESNDDLEVKNDVDSRRNALRFERESYNYYREIYKYDSCIKSGAKIVLLGGGDLRFLLGLVDVLEEASDISSAYHMSKFVFYADMSFSNRKALLNIIRFMPLTKKSSSTLEKIKFFFHAISLKPSGGTVLVYRALDLMASSQSWLGLTASEFKNVLQIALRSTKPSTQKGLALLDEGRIDLVKKLLDVIPPSQNVGVESLLLYSSYMTLNGGIDEAIDLIKKNVSLNPSDEKLCKELLRLYKIKGDFLSAEQLYNSWKSDGKDLGYSVQQPILLGQRRIKDGYSTYRDMPLRKSLARAFPDKYLLGEESLPRIGKVLVLSAWGPGDEIRFASLYPAIFELLEGADVAFSCDHRLLPMLENSFPNLKFVPAKRVRSLDGERYTLEDFSRVPCFTLHSLIDNNIVDYAESVDRVLLISDLISELRSSESDFPRNPYFRFPGKSTPLIQDVSDQPLRVGISWRSSLDDRTRLVHYLTVEDLLPVFRIPGVEFYCLQYDDCGAELEFVNDNCGRPISVPAGLDQFNDFEGVADFMGELDLVIAPASSVAELSGALGVPTLLFYRSQEVRWRMCSDGHDIWHRSVKHVSLNGSTDRSVLVDLIVDEVVHMKQRKCSLAGANDSKVLAST
ncbi:capsular polysaccharide export protein, LipB/KpsS family [Marinobacter nauticus]|uniref:capsular polysaccharide export protein, LipB/KpsS family n=1 Tax=Marinobacter nauticus TaxID=2743 RepID=UPI0037362EDD